MSDPFQIGDSLAITGLFTDRDGDPMDPDAVVLTVTLPDHTQDVYTAGVDAEMTNPIPGTHIGEIQATAAGRWWLRLVGTGAPGDPSQAEQTSFYVEQIPS